MKTKSFVVPYRIGVRISFFLRVSFELQRVCLYKVSSDGDFPHLKKEIIVELRLFKIKLHATSVAYYVL